MNDGYGQQLLAQYRKDGGTPLCYRENPRCLAAVAFAWLGWIGVGMSWASMLSSINHTKKGLGPKSTHARLRDGGGEQGSMELSSKTDEPEGRQEAAIAPPPREGAVSVVRDG